MYFEIYQIKDIENCKYAFMSYDFAEKVGGVNITDYKRVAWGNGKGIFNTLDDIYEYFNLTPPETYKGRSVSVSDLICIDDEDWYYVDDFGFKHLGSFEMQTFNGQEFRICSICGSVMIDGFATPCGFMHYCSEECLHEDYTPDEYQKAYEADECFYTEWY